MLTALFSRIGWTRDDLKFTIATTAAVVVGLASLSDTAAGAFGIPPTWLPYIRLGAFIVGIISAKMSTSGLSGKAATWLLVAMLGSAVILPGCAGKAAPDLTPTAKVELVALDVLAALSDAQDGVIAANHAGWLDDHTTGIVIRAIQVGIEAAHTAPQGAKPAAMAALAQAQQQLSGDALTKALPYLNAARAVIGGL